MATFRNEFSWSASRDRLFRSCPRAYYYNYYAYWNGWSYKADAKTKLIYRLKKLQSTALWAGSIVHDVIQDFLELKQKIAISPSQPELHEVHYELLHLINLHQCETTSYTGELKEKAALELSALKQVAQAIDAGESPHFNEHYLHAIARLKLRRGFKESLAQKKHPDNKKLHLYEHFYHEPLGREEADKVSNKIYSALSAFFSAPAVRSMLATPVGNWKSIDELTKYNLKKLLTTVDDHERFFYKDIPVWCAIDFAYIDHAGELWIVDWKTGKENKAELQNQLASYAIFANQEWGVDFDKIHLCGIYLNEEGRMSEYPLTLAEIQEARESIANSCRGMLSLLDDQPQNETSERHFIPSPDSFKCRYCNFKQVCEAKVD